MSLGKWILGGLGFAVGGPIGALIGVLIGSVFDSAKQTVDNETSRHRTSRASQRSTQGDISVSIIVLLACVIKADGRVLKSEINFVKPFLLRKNFASRRTFVRLRVTLNPCYNTGLGSVCPFQTFFPIP